jgi:16S rRNA C967 or C1407 C5-methylase (RsmB/RsmF family)/NOL1/NOP2/fmu family ribosome biogenesis protein
MEALLGKEAPLFFEALQKEPSRSLRFDPGLTSRRQIEEFLGEGKALEEVPFGEHALYFEFDGIGSTALHHAGAVYVQEPAAMAPVFSLPKNLNVSSILDLCAAPGGKSLQAAARHLKEGGLLVCNEPSAQRRRVLMQNIERLGEKRALVTGFEAQSIPEEFFGFFDLVLVDAPCSGEGMMRKSEEAVLLWSKENILLCAERQKAILNRAAKATAAGGILLYSTCTWAREENEDRVAEFLTENPEFSLLAPAPEVANMGSEGLVPCTLRFYPHRFRGEGQFLAIFQKEGEKELPRKRKQNKKKPKPDPREEIVWAFLSEVLEEKPEGKILFRGEEAFLVPEHPFSEEHFASPGVLLGTVQKGRVLPHHRFFRAFADSFANRHVLEMGDARIEAYLRGEEISLSGKGYGVLFAEKMPLGGVKVSQGRGKNYYPKGLRKV